MAIEAYHRESTRIKLVSLYYGLRFCNQGVVFSGPPVLNKRGDAIHIDEPSSLFERMF